MNIPRYLPTRSDTTRTTCETSTTSTRPGETHAQLRAQTTDGGTGHGSWEKPRLPNHSLTDRSSNPLGALFSR